MHSPSSNGGPTFRIEMSAAVKEHILGLQQQATLNGRGDEFIDAMESILEKIRHSARSAGEPLYRLPALKMQIRLIAQQPVVVYYGVCEDRRVVYVKSIVMSR